MTNRIRQALKKVIPYPLHVFFSHPPRSDARRDNVRRDRTRFDIGKHLYLEAYWKIYGVGKGPALALNAHGYEILLFDCYGPGAGHAHIKVMQWRPETVEYYMLREQETIEQIDRAIFEIEHNLDWYLQRHPLSRIRKLRADAELLQSVLPEVRKLLIEYKKRVEGTKA
jgi:hypothetical protein